MSKKKRVALDALVGATKALGHPGRLRILGMLRDGPLCVCQITAVLRLSGSTVSAHLSELRRAGLVAERKQAKWVYYRLVDDGSLAALVQEAFRLVGDDRQLREDARIIRAVKAVPVDDFCRSGQDLAMIGVKRP